MTESKELSMDEQMALQSENKQLRRDANLANELEGIIAMRANFTGEPPYVGDSGVILALNELIWENDELKAQVNELREFVSSIRKTPPIQLSFDGVAHKSCVLLDKTAAQCLATHNASITEKLCSEFSAEIEDQSSMISTLKSKLELIQQAERLQADLHEAALAKLIESDKQNDELKLAITLIRFAGHTPLCDGAGPAQLILEHNSVIEEEVTERCAKIASAHCGIGSSTEIATAIRNMPRQYKGE